MTFKIWGTEDLVHMIAGTTVDRPVAASLPNGGYVVAWADHSGKLSFQRYDGNGAKNGGQVVVSAANVPHANVHDIVVNQTTGSFVVTWSEQVGTEKSLYSQRFTIDGAAAGDRFSYFQGSIASSTDLHTSAANTASSSGSAAVYTFEGNLIFHINDEGGGVDTRIDTVSSSAMPDVAYLGGTQHVVTYQKNGATQVRIVDNNAVTAFSASITGVRAEVVGLQLNDTPTGAFAVISDTGSAIKAHIYESSTDTMATVVDIASGKPSTGDHITVTALDDCRFAVTYIAATEGDFGDVLLKIVSADGQTVTGPLLLNARAGVDSVGAQVEPSISQMADGRLAVTWRDPTLGNSIISTTVVDPRLMAVTVNGTEGNDVYAPSELAGDVLDGKGGTDTLTFKGASAGVAVNLATESGSAGDANGDTYKNFENIIGSNFSDNLTGNDGVNRLEGGAGDDLLNGAAGADVMNGGAGNDVYYVDNSGDAVQESGAADGGYDTVYASATYTLSAYVENLLAQGSGAINLTGNDIGNRIVGNEAANALAGLNGNDTLEGAGGNDNLDGGEGNDALYGGAGDDALVGGGGNDHMEGGDGNDNLTGGDGNDVLVGGLGADRMNGGAGNDTYYIDNPGDVVADGAGFDTVIVATGSYNLASLSGIENIVGAGTAPITFIGDSGHNTITGNDGANIIYGHNGNDRLSGGAGDDRIHGGFGKDVMWGGPGRDVFVFDKKPHKRHKDKIEDFNPREDSFFVENKYFKIGKKGSLTKPAKMAKKMFYKGSKAHDKDDRFIYDKKKGKLFYDKDGTGSSKQIEIASLDKNLKISANDFFGI